MQIRVGEYDCRGVWTELLELLLHLLIVLRPEHTVEKFTEFSRCIMWVLVDAHSLGCGLGAPPPPGRTRLGTLCVSVLSSNSCGASENQGWSDSRGG